MIDRRRYSAVLVVALCAIGVLAVQLMAEQATAQLLPGAGPGRGFRLVTEHADTVLLAAAPVELDGEQLIRIDFGPIAKVERIALQRDVDVSSFLPTASAITVTVEIRDASFRDGVTMFVTRSCVEGSSVPGLNQPGELDQAVNDVSAEGWNRTGSIDLLEASAPLRFTVEKSWSDVVRVEVPSVATSVSASVQIEDASIDDGFEGATCLQVREQ